MARGGAPARVYRGGGEGNLLRGCPELTPEQAAKVIDAEIEKVVERLTSQQAHFTREDIVRDVCIATVTQRIAPREIHERVTETLRGERFLSLGRHRNQDASRPARSFMRLRRARSRRPRS